MSQKHKKLEIPKGLLEKQKEKVKPKETLVESKEIPKDKTLKETLEEKLLGPIPEELLQTRLILPNNPKYQDKSYTFGQYIEWADSQKTSLSELSDIFNKTLAKSRDDCNAEITRFIGLSPTSYFDETNVMGTIPIGNIPQNVQSKFKRLWAVPELSYLKKLNNFLNGLETITNETLDIISSPDSDYIKLPISGSIFNLFQNLDPFIAKISYYRQMERLGVVLQEMNLQPKKGKGSTATASTVQKTQKTYNPLGIIQNYVSFFSHLVSYGKNGFYAFSALFSRNNKKNEDHTKRTQPTYTTQVSDIKLQTHLVEEFASETKIPTVDTPFGPYQPTTPSATAFEPSVVDSQNQTPATTWDSLDSAVAASAPLQPVNTDFTITVASNTQKEITVSKPKPSLYADYVKQYASSLKGLFADVGERLRKPTTGALLGIGAFIVACSVGITMYGAQSDSLNRQKAMQFERKPIKASIAANQNPTYSYDCISNCHIPQPFAAANLVAVDISDCKSCHATPPALTLTTSKPDYSSDCGDCHELSLPTSQQSGGIRLSEKEFAALTSALENNTDNSQSSQKPVKPSKSEGKAPKLSTSPAITSYNCPNCHTPQSFGYYQKNEHKTRQTTQTSSPQNLSLESKIETPKSIQKTKTPKPLGAYDPKTGVYQANRFATLDEHMALLLELKDGKKPTTKEVETEIYKMGKVTYEEYDLMKDMEEYDLADKDPTLMSGERIILKTTTPKPTLTAETIPNESVAESKKQSGIEQTALTLEYTVKPKDNLWNIIKQQHQDYFGYQPANEHISALVRENAQSLGLKDAGKIYPNDQFKLIIREKPSQKSSSIDSLMLNETESAYSSQKPNICPNPSMGDNLKATSTIYQQIRQSSGGRVTKTTKESAERVAIYQALRNEGLNNKEASFATGVTPRTGQRYQKELQKIREYQTIKLPNESHGITFFIPQQYSNKGMLIQNV